MSDNTQEHIDALIAAFPRVFRELAHGGWIIDPSAERCETAIERALRARGLFVESQIFCDGGPSGRWMRVNWTMWTDAGLVCPCATITRPLDGFELAVIRHARITTPFFVACLLDYEVHLALEASGLLDEGDKLELSPELAWYTWPRYPLSERA